MPLICTAETQPLRAHLIRIHKQELVDNQWEQHIQEEDLVTPDDALLLSLLVKPPGPLVLDKLILKIVFVCHIRYKLLFADTGNKNNLLWLRKTSQATNHNYGTSKAHLLYQQSNEGMWPWLTCDYVKNTYKLSVKSSFFMISNHTWDDQKSLSEGFYITNLCVCVFKGNGLCLNLISVKHFFELDFKPFSPLGLIQGMTWQTQILWTSLLPSTLSDSKYKYPRGPEVNYLSRRDITEYIKSCLIHSTEQQRKRCK